jgi:hypothetical protein
MLDSLAEVKKMLDEIKDQLDIQFSEVKFNQKYSLLKESMVDINVYFDDFVLHLITYANIEDLAPRLRTLIENMRNVRI